MPNPQQQEKPRCEHGVLLGELDESIAQLDGEARATACPDCWPSLYGASEDGLDLQDTLDPPLVDIQRRLRSLRKKRP